MTKLERDALCMSLWSKFQAAHRRWVQSQNPVDLGKAVELMEKHNRFFLGGEP